MVPKAKIIYDRKKTAASKGIGAVELYIYFSRQEKSYILMAKKTPSEWKHYQHCEELRRKVVDCDAIICAMHANGEPMTIRNFTSKFVSIAGSSVIKKSFLDFVRDAIAEDKNRESTKRNKRITLDALIRFGGIKDFKDLTVDNLRAFDKWLRGEAARTDLTVNNYHKHMKKWTRLAYEEHLTNEDPYCRVHFPRGKSKERAPLAEEELKMLRDLPLYGHLAHARDLFIFSAYTGLAYCDVCAFDFHRMTERVGEMYYIDGARLKNGNKFFTPILPPAMEVLERYGFKLRTMSNQKVNDYLHSLEGRIGTNKPITFHVARHSFATLCLSHDVPVEKVARMLGHSDIKTTQIYAKILKETVARHGQQLAASIL